MQSVWGARAGIIFADAWMWSPFVMLLVLAGLVSVPKYLYEAAAIDRVPAWRQFWSITLPYIRGLLLLALLFRTIEAFKLFDVVFLLTEGGPGTATETIAVYVYRVAFQYVKTSESSGARLHPAVHGHRAYQPLSLFRQPAREGGLISMSDAAMPVTTEGHRHASGRAFRAVGVSRRFRRRRGGMGPYAAGGRRQHHLFLPRALDHPHLLQEL